MINYEIPHNESSYEEHIIAIHLKEVISDKTAQKIINGIPVQKDGKDLINKKSIPTFLTYLADEMYKIATEQRKNQSKKDKKNWTALAKDGNYIIERALAYFDDDTIEGELYEQDGKLYKPAPSKTPDNVIRTVQATTVTRKPEPPKPQQFTLFNFLEQTKETPVEETEDLDEDEDNCEETEEVEETDQEEIKDDISDKYEINRETGEILGKKVKTEPELPPSFSTYLHYKKQYPKHIILSRLNSNSCSEIFVNFVVVPNLSKTASIKQLSALKVTSLISPEYIPNNSALCFPISKFSNISIFLITW